MRVVWEEIADRFDALISKVPFVVITRKRLEDKQETAFEFGRRVEGYVIEEPRHLRVVQ